MFFWSENESSALTPSRTIGRLEDMPRRVLVLLLLMVTCLGMGLTYSVRQIHACQRAAEAELSLRGVRIELQLAGIELSRQHYAVLRFAGWDLHGYATRQLYVWWSLKDREVMFVSP